MGQGRIAPDASRPPEPAPDAAASVPAAPVASGGVDEDGELAEAEFDVPVNTYTTQPVDIIESRASRGAPAPTAADEVARALAGPETDLAPSTIPDDGTSTLRGRAKVDLGAEGGDVAEQPVRVHLRTPIGRAAREIPGASESDEEQLCAIADDASSEARLAALRVLRTRLARPRVRALADRLQGELKGPAERAVVAAGALGELRDAMAVPALIDVLEGTPAVARTAARALVEIAQQDFGLSRKKWLAWWEPHKKTDRVVWLLEGLSHRSPEIRFASSEELRLITGEYFGYHFDLPKREREEARERWQQWWYQSRASSGP